MGEVNEIVNLFYNYLTDEDLNREISSTSNLKCLLILLDMKRKRILNGEGKWIVYSMNKIYERNDEIEDLQLLCEVLKSTLSVVKNPEEAIVDVITYLNTQITQGNAELKVAQLLNEIILTCRNRKKEYIFQENTNVHVLIRFLLCHIKTENSLKAYILYTLLPNYVLLMDETAQLNLLYDIMYDISILCIVFNYIDEKVLLTNRKSILFSDGFWLYIQQCISCTNHWQVKQAVFILKKWIQTIHNYNFEYKIPYLVSSNISHETSEKVWQHFFTILDASKEKQLHLVWPSLTLLESVKHIDIMWRVCIYRKLLAHAQSAVVYFVASHILHEKIFYPTINQEFLAAINRSEYTDDSIKMFAKLKNFCNNLKLEEFVLFLEDTIEIIWSPAALCCFIANIFSEEMRHVVPFKLLGPFCKLLKRLPHIYIRNSCMKMFLNYFTRHFNWKSSFDEIMKLLFILKDYDINLFAQSVTDYFQKDILNTILQKIQEHSLDCHTFEICVLIFKLLKYDIGIKTVLKLTTMKQNNLKLVVYANLYENCEINSIEKFVLTEITNVDDDCSQMFVQITTKLMKSDDNFSKVMYRKMLNILGEADSYNKTTISIIFHIILNTYKPSQDVTAVIRLLKIQINDRIENEQYLILFLKLYFLTQDYPQYDFIIDIFNKQSDAIISEVFNCFYFRDLDNDNNNNALIAILKTFLCKLLISLTKSSYFKPTVCNVINFIFSTDFLYVSYRNDNKMEIIKMVTETLLSLSETFQIINYYLSERIKDVTYSSEFHRQMYFSLIPSIVELLLRDMVIKKEDRTEYYICQEIFKTLNNLKVNPNINKITTKMSGVESMLRCVHNDSKLADDFTIGLIDKYRPFFNKRYFPDSQIHLQKLRIIQALLLISPYINKQRHFLITSIMESFATEIHQPCVKQLMQWLLLLLIKEHEEVYFNMLKEKVNATSKTKPSSIVAFIVVLYHLTITKGQSYWFSTAEALIPWTMGANFKLRVYSQVALRQLLKKARRKRYMNFLVKYSYLEISIFSVMKTAGQAFNDTLKTDKLIFSTFKPKRDYSIESIYVSIPKLNGVTQTEWENVFQYKFNMNQSVQFFNKCRIFEKSVDKYITSRSIESVSNGCKLENAHIIQRKITPWEVLLKEQDSTKALGDFILIASLVDKEANLGGLCRTCEVFNIKQLVLNDVKVVNNKEFKSLSMSSEEWIDAIEVKVSNLKQFICEMRSKGYSIIGAEQTSESVYLDKYIFPKKVALILGNEKEGIPPDLIPLLDKCVEIPQFGMIRSLNVHVAGATFIWEYAKQHLVQ